MRRQFVLGELPQHHRFLLGQNTRMQQLGEHALNAVGVFADVFQKQNTTLDLREIRRAQEAHQHGQIAAPQRRVLRPNALTFVRQSFSASRGQAPPCPFTLPAQHVVKTGFHDVVWLLLTKVFAQCRTCP